MLGPNVGVSTRFKKRIYTPNYNRLHKGPCRRLGIDPEWMAIDGLHGMLVRNDFTLHIRTLRKIMELPLHEGRSDLTEKQFYDEQIYVNYGHHRPPGTCSKERCDLEEEVAWGVAKATDMRAFPAGSPDPARAVIAGVVVFGKLWQTRGTLIVPHRAPALAA